MTHQATTLTRVHADADQSALERAFQDIRESQDVREDFSAEALAEAEAAAQNPSLPEEDLTAIEFITIDPPGSMDLDQAMHIEAIDDTSEGAFRVCYAIADVPAFVAPGGALDAEVRLRGQTIYCPDKRVALHPPVMSEAAASLLPDETRPAYVWNIVLDEHGETLSAIVARAMVRSRRRYTYTEVQQAVDEGNGESTLMLLRDVGRLLVAQESARGGASLPMPEQEVEESDGTYELRLRPLLEAEDWNAQISLLTGRSAADLMIAGKVGILRTMPPPRQDAIDRFRMQVLGVDLPWDESVSYGDFLRGLDWANPVHLAIIHAATSLFRGAGYTPFNGVVPEETEQAAIGAPYAHVTAPLRRLIDRFGLVVCAALSAGEEVPEWVMNSLEELPDLMSESGRRANSVDRACIDAVEAAVLQDRVGQEFAASVVEETSRDDLIIQVTDPVVLAYCDGDAELGERITVKLTLADLNARKVRFKVAPQVG
ncbi:RNB domain-containing ribonuclease [Ornithinimicrobium sp. Arc0846-15]|nr:RNB domain-containing ribonuclease [Ornithinimicrobium laminariae]